MQTALGGLPEHQRPGPARRPAARAARHRVAAAQRDPRRVVREAEGRAVRVPAAGPRGLPDQRRRAVRARPAAQREDPGRAGDRLQLAEPDHFRVVTLPRVADLEDAIGRIGRFLATYRQA